MPELLEGPDSLKCLPEFIRGKGLLRVLVVTDKGIMSLGLLDGLLQGLKETGIEYAIYDNTVANPTIDNIEEALEAYKRDACQGIIAVGGGSSMDCAKGVGARIARPNKTIPKMKGQFKVLKKLPPLFAVPTTAGTGSETTVAAVITDSRTHEK
jgi:alcohol dehydrogenase class IV